MNADDVVLRYRGRVITPAEVADIRARIAADPTLHRLRLSRELCEAWNWRQANGHLRDMVCRGLLLQLHRAGVITLPPPRHRSVNNHVVRHRQPRRVPLPEQSPIRCSLADLGPLTIRQVRRTPDEALVDTLIATHHELGFVRPVGEALKFLVTAGSAPVACMVWSSAPRHLGPRDRFIGWSAAARRAQIHLLAYNTRYLILPWVTVPHLASHILGWMARNLSTVWQELYSHPIHLVETFVDPTRHRGTCYRAANWIHVGQTTGRGIHNKTHAQTRTIKDVWVLPLLRRFRAHLCREEAAR